MVLDHVGGPNFVNNFIDAAVIVPKDKDEFYKQPMFYAIGHFSKFVPRDSVRIAIELVTGDIANVAFLRPDGGIVVILWNS